MAYSVSILHLSDLHFGNKNRFMNKDEDAKSLGEKCACSIISEIDRLHIPEIKLVMVTGDIAEYAEKKEYEYALDFFNSLKQHLSLDSSQFVFLPGNHDVSWSACEKITEEVRSSGEIDTTIEKEIDKVKFKTFDQEFIGKFFGKKWRELSVCLPKDGHLYDFDELKISVAALNTCEKEDNLKQIGCLGSKQAQQLMKLWKDNKYDTFFKIIAIHHNATAVPEEVIRQEIELLPPGKSTFNSEEMQKKYRDIGGIEGKNRLFEIIGQCEVHLLLYGHQHFPHTPQPVRWKNSDNYCQVLTTGSFGLLKEVMPGEDTMNCFSIHSIISSGEKKMNLTTNSLEYTTNETLDGFVDPGCFRSYKRSLSPTSIHFEQTDSFSEESGELRDPDILKIARDAIVNILNKNPVLENKLCSEFKFESNLIADELVTQGLYEPWKKINRMLEHGVVAINEVEGILYWLATAEARKEKVKHYQQEIQKNESEFTYWLNAHFPVIIEIIIAAAYKRQIYIEQIQIYDPDKKQFVEMIIGKDLIFDTHKGFILSHTVQGIKDLIKERIPKVWGELREKDIEERLESLAVGGRPLYVITKAECKPLPIKNLLEFKLRSSDNDEPPTARGEMIIYTVLEQILDRVTRRKNERIFSSQRV